jgi:hypothetical protein
MKSQRISTTPKFQDKLSAGKIKTSVFWAGEVINVDFLPHGVTISAHYYRNLLHNEARQTIQQKKTLELSKKIFPLHDDACPHTVNLAKATLVTMGCKIMNHPPYSPDLVPTDFHLFETMKVHLVEKFLTDDEFKPMF